MLTIETQLEIMRRGWDQPHYFGESSYPYGPYSSRNEERMRDKTDTWIEYKKWGVKIVHPMPNVTRDSDGRVLAHDIKTGTMVPVSLIRL